LSSVRINPHFAVGVPQMRNVLKVSTFDLVISNLADPAELKRETRQSRDVRAARSARERAGKSALLAEY